MTVYTNEMPSIKFSRTKRELKINGDTHIGFDLTNLPTKFAYIYDAIDDRDGIRRWFNYKGLTWVRKKDL
jgi:hypothetical protein